MKGKNKFIISIAVFCVYLMFTFPVSFAASTGHFVQVNIKNSEGTSTLETANLPSFETLVAKPPIAPSEESGGIFINITVGKRIYEIKNVYVWLCKNNLIDACLRGNKPSFSSPKFLQVKRAWSDIADLKGSGNVYPQNGSIFTLVNLNVKEQDIWTGSFETITRTGAGLSSFSTKSFDVSSVDILLKEDSFANITRDFINNNYVLPRTWLKDTDSIVLGLVNNKPTKAIQHFGFDATQTPDNFDPGKIIGDKVSPQTLNQYELLFAEGSLSNPITVFKNPTGTCGNGVAETQLGETETSCCNDVGCSKTGFVCNKDPRDQNRAGVCTDTSTLQLVNRGVKKSSFKSCEIDHEVQLDVEVLNAPTGTKVNDFFYQLGNKTRTDIQCNQAQNTNKLVYECEFTIEAFEDCSQGPPRTLKDNVVFASVALPDNSIKELNSSINDFVITQQTESFNDITTFTEKRMTEIGTKLEKGVGKAEKLVNTCAKFIEKAVVFAEIMAVLSIVAAGIGLWKSLKGGSDTSSGGRSGGSGTIGTGAGSGSNQPVGAGGTTVVVGDIVGGAQAGLFGAAKVFLESIGVVVEAGLSICEVAKTMLNVYVDISKALTSFTTFQICVKTYQNMLGRGACSSGDPNNPNSVIDSSLQCISQLQRCSGYLNQMSSDLEGLSQNAKQAKEKFKTPSTQGSKQVDFFVHEEGYGRTINTCDDRSVRIGVAVGTDGCEGDPKVTLQKTDTSATSNIQASVNDVNSEISNLRNLVSSLKNTADASIIGQLSSDIRNSATNIKNSAASLQSAIQASGGGFTDVISNANSITKEAEQIEALSGSLKGRETIVNGRIGNIEKFKINIENDIKNTGQQDDITSRVYGPFNKGPGPWGTATPASTIFSKGDGKYIFSFECPGVNTKTLPIDYSKDCSQIKRGAPLTGVGQKGPTSKLGLQIIDFANSRGKLANKQLDGNFYLNTHKIDVKVNNKDIEAQKAGRPDRIIGKCWLDLKQAGLGLSTVRRGSQIFVDKITGAASGSTSRPGLELTGASITNEILPIEMNPQLNWGKQDIDVIYECEDVSSTVFEQTNEKAILDTSLTDAQIIGIVPQAVNATVTSGTTTGPSSGATPQITAHSNQGTSVNVISALVSWSDPSIQKCNVDWGDTGQHDAILSGQTLSHLYGQTGTYSVRYNCFDSAGKVIATGVMNTYNVIGPGSSSSTRTGNPPVVAINSPSSGSNVRGTVGIDFSVTDQDADLSEIEVRVIEPSFPGFTAGTIRFDQKESTTGGSYTKTFNWNSSTVSNGEYLVEVNARDHASSTWQSKDIRITVNN